MSRYAIRYDFGDVSGVTQWLLLDGGVVLHAGTYADMCAKLARLEGRG